MGIYTSRPIIIGRDDVSDSRGLPWVTRPAFLCRSLSRVTRPAFLCRSKFRTVSKKYFAGILSDSSCYLVYARFSNEDIFETQLVYALDIKKKKKVLLPNSPMESYTDNASSVLDNKLYIIGGTSGAFVSSSVHFFDPLLNKWSDTKSTAVPRTDSVAVTVDGKIYLFGGCDSEMGDWGEVYDPSTRMWTPIATSQVVIEALDRGLCPLQTSAVLGKNIILRGPRTAIAFDVVTNSWTNVSENLIKFWWGCTRAAVVQNMLITCHRECGQREILQLSIRAYDPDQDVWLLLEGIDSSFHENAYRSKFMAVNGNLVIYQMWDENYLRFSIIEINEKLRTTVRVNLLWQSRFAIKKIIGKDLESDVEHDGESLYENCVLEAFRANSL